MSKSELMLHKCFHNVFEKLSIFIIDRGATDFLNKNVSRTAFCNYMIKL